MHYHWVFARISPAVALLVVIEFLADCRSIHSRHCSWQSQSKFAFIGLFWGSWRSWPRPAVSIVDGYERPLGLQSPFQFGYNGGMIDPAPKTRWYRLTPDRYVILGLLVVVCLLWLSERFGWLPWHKGYAVLTALAVVGVTFVGMLLWFIVGSGLPVAVSIQYSVVAG